MQSFSMVGEIFWIKPAKSYTSKISLKSIFEEKWETDQGGLLVDRKV